MEYKEATCPGMTSCLKEPGRVGNPPFSVVLYCCELQQMTLGEWHSSSLLPDSGGTPVLPCSFATPERTTSPLTAPLLVVESTALCKNSVVTPSVGSTRVHLANFGMLMRVWGNGNACTLLAGLSVSAAIVENPMEESSSSSVLCLFGRNGITAIAENPMEESSNSSVLCLFGRNGIVPSKRHLHTLVPLLKVYTIQEEFWQFYAVCGQGYNAN